VGIELKLSEHYNEYSSRLRDYLTLDLCEYIVNNHIRKEIQADCRTRYWAYLKQYGKYLRVVVDSDGETIATAFFDRGFKL